MKPIARITVAVVSLAVATWLAPHPMSAQTPPQTARWIPPRLPLTIHALRCEYGGAVPGISIYFDASSTARITGIRAGSLLIGNSTAGWAIGNDGALSIRTWSGVPGTASATPRVFTGSMSPGTAEHFQVFARLAMSAFGGASYPDRRLEFRLVLEATEGVFAIDGPPCVITPAG